REGRARKIAITRNPLTECVGEQASQVSQVSQPPQDQALGGDSRTGTNRDTRAGHVSGENAQADGDTWLKAPSREASRANPLKSNGNDTGNTSDTKISSQSGAGPVCRRCGAPGSETFGRLVPCGADGSAGLYHLRCWTEERTKPGRQCSGTADLRSGSGRRSAMTDKQPS